MNAFTRKQVEQVCEAFVLARKSSSHIFLTVTVQGTLLPESFSRKFSSISGLEIITKHLSYEEVCSLYLETDICIQVSRHEGLGLGFFEALALGVPVLTLNTAPHNEIVTDDLGWKIPCTYEPIKENNDAVMEAAIFQLKDLSEKLVHLAEHPLEVEEISNKVLASAALFSTKKHSFAQTFAEALD
jgi:glycosyltransferase involved in cell wall biosynthesis